MAKDYSVFLLDGEKFYDFDGWIIPGKRYEMLKLTKGHDSIIMDDCTNLKDIMKRSWEEIEKEKRKILIHNFGEYVNYLLDEILPEDKAQEIRERQGELKKVKDFINLFPDVYRPLLRLRLMKDKRDMENASREMESLEKTIYNPNAFIGEE